MSYPLDVLIVGAGPIGLTLACHLRRLGLTVRLIEKRTGPSVHSKAIGLQYRVSEVLARLGAYAVTAKAAAAGERSLPALFDRTGDFADLYGFQSDFLCLIRPDGHVGLVQFPPNPERLQSYLALMCERTELQRAFASTDWGFSGG